MRRGYWRRDYDRDLAEIEREQALLLERVPLAQAARGLAFQLLNVTLDEGQRREIETLVFLLGCYERVDIPGEDSDQLLVGLGSLMEGSCSV
jgi:hypothetical protein